MKYYILPFGCQMNRSDSERVRTVLNGMGYVESDDENDPEVTIRGIIACSVRQKAIDRVYGRIRNWNAVKSERSTLTFISGCVLPADREKFLKMFDLVFPIDQLPELPDMILHYGVPTPGAFEVPRVETGMVSSDQPPEVGQAIIPFEIGAPALGKPGREEARKRIESFWKVKPSYTSPVEAYVPIQNGCDKFCTFCAVPYTRGREVSRPSAEILAEVRFLVNNGCKSVMLLGQNVNSYGLDKKGEELSFPELMRAVGEIGRETEIEFRTYFTSPHPRDITRNLLEVMSEYEVLANWIHLPLQSGDDKVLLKMNRNHSMDRYRSVVNDIRRILPEAALFTDIIVGFSGESEEQFEHTADVMREFKYDMAYIARYSPRPGAASARWDDDVSREEKERRFRKLSTILLEITTPLNRRRVGTVERVLVTGEDRKVGFLSGYTEGRIPVRLAAEGVGIGDFVEVEIISARPLSIEGRVC